ncbi:MAG: hypothetical protein E5W81_00585 [Mesorhizobium sp.]|uniref:hypothetical protein n=1 Tax=Mesorhizobium sp. TaxID=1871066 RepID=UPI00121EDC91|nr:hypothetical protein [Mesorhizobium sp.]TIT21308.1 MAG: hypothetical protein E5W70_17495 [Mesorhizobium sp.]TIX46128.1 MAG: hypothetical protein E5V36_02815 [Mesorhizobium sp.]TKC02190.1 MAG: hypothetical protein E5W81_00585 [Mesorhizobium sp.]
MNPVVKSALAGVVALAGFAPVQSFAQDASCTCATAYQGVGPIGSIGHVDGDVMISQVAGYGPAQAGGALDFGSRVVVGGKGSASVHVGGCNLSVPANSTLDISRVENKICLNVLGSEQTAQTGGSNNNNNTPLYIFGGMALGAGILAATADKDHGVSQ